MSPNPGVVLTLLDDSELRETVERVAAAVGVRAVPVHAAPARKAWNTAAAVVLDEPGARRCERAGLQRRSGVILVVSGAPQVADWQAAMALGAEHLCALPDRESDLVRQLADAAEAGRTGDGRVIAVAAGRGGAGASVLAAAMALLAADALLVDLDPWSGGIDLLLGAESEPGLRWPDLDLHGGRLSWTPVREALPRHRGVSVLSATRRSHEMDAGPVESVLDAGRRGGVTVITDLPRRLTEAAVCALDHADLAVLVVTCDVRGIAAASTFAQVLRALNPNLGLVARGPSPGGLRARDVADVVGVPLLAAMRPEPTLAERLEHGGLRLRRRSPLATTARRVLELVQRSAPRQAA